MENEIASFKKVRNGWVAMDRYGDVIAVATTDDQMMNLLEIEMPQPKTLVDDLSINLRFTDEGAMHRMFTHINRGQKIDAIKELRSMFYAEGRVNKVSIGLREAKDIVEAIMEYVPRDY